MATSTSVSATFNFVKRYPIVLCGLSLLFTPSVHRLLLYFTPLLLSTAIFIVAMTSLGPSTPSSAHRGRRRGFAKRRSAADVWAFNESLRMDDKEDDEDMEEVDLQQDEILVSQLEKPNNDTLHDVTSHNAKAEPDPDLNLEAQLKPVHRQRRCVEMGCNDPLCLELGSQAVPADPDLHRECVRAASTSASAVQHAEPDPDLHAEQHAEPNPHFADHRPELSASHQHDEHAQMSPDQHSALHHPEPDPGLHGDSADEHHQREGRSDEDVEGDLHAATPELGAMIRKAPNTANDSLDMELAKAAVARIGVSGASSGSFPRQCAPDRLRVVHTVA